MGSTLEYIPRLKPRKELKEKQDEIKKATALVEASRQAERELHLLMEKALILAKASLETNNKGMICPGSARTYFATEAIKYP